MRSPYARSSRTQIEWNVPARSPRPASPSRPWRRSRISPAALLVKVTARIELGSTARALTRCAIRWVSARVLPLPAPAITSSGEPWCKTTSR